jgi:hypothetical protein
MHQEIVNGSVKVLPAGWIQKLILVWQLVSHRAPAGRLLACSDKPGGSNPEPGHSGKRGSDWRESEKSRHSGLWNHVHEIDHE